MKFLFLGFACLTLALLYWLRSTSPKVASAIVASVGKNLWSQNVLVDSSAIDRGVEDNSVGEPSVSVPTSDEAPVDQAAADEAAADKGTDESASDEAAADKVEAEQAVRDKAASDDAVVTAGFVAASQEAVVTASPVVASDVVQSLAKAGAIDHSPFVIDKHNFGNEPFSAKVRDFLETAPRSKPVDDSICKVQKSPWQSFCPSWLWLTMYHAPDKENRPAVFVDIGCNKGYSIASWYEQFAPSSGVNKKAICNIHKSLQTPKYQGVCLDCKEKAKFGNGGGPAPKAYCIDGSPHTHAKTKQLAKMLQKDMPLAQGWKLFHNAMTNATGSITYEDCSNEDCGVARPGDKQRTKKRWRTVPAMTYDDFAKANSIDFADLVKIDTEGEEPLIIQGMHESLQAKRVGFLAFEVHGSGKGWYRAFDMARIVDLLDAYGYTCYMDSMAPAKISLLTGCAGPRFTQSYQYYLYTPPFYKEIGGVIPQWGNAICGLRDGNPEIPRILKWMNENFGAPELLQRDGFYAHQGEISSLKGPGHR